MRKNAFAKNNVLFQSSSEDLKNSAETFGRDLNIFEIDLTILETSF